MKRLIVISLALLGLAVGTLQLLPAPAYASAQDEACKGFGGTASGGNCSTKGPTVGSLITTFVNLFSIIIGIVAVIMIMVGGFKYVTANGDGGQISSAKSTIMYAIIGLIVAGLAQFIVQFVLERFLGATPKDEEKETYYSRYYS